MKTRSKTKLEKEKGLPRDRITSLPLDAIHCVLTYLPIRDAVRTSILSTQWKHKWTTIPQLVFDDACVLRTSSDTIQDCRSKFAGFVTQVFSLHKGPIQKLKLSGTYLESCPATESWIENFVSCTDIKEFTFILEDDKEFFDLPFRVYESLNLTHLELLRCLVFPPFLPGDFSNLTTLNLQKCFIQRRRVEDIIENCPRLENFTLTYYGTLKLCIYAPNLKYLFIEGEFTDLCIHGTLLATLHVSSFYTDETLNYLERTTNCNMFDVIGYTPHLERFIIKCNSAKHLSKNIPNSLGQSYDRLRKLELYHVDFEDLDQIKVVILLMENSPNLEELICSSFTFEEVAAEPDLDYWETKHLLGYYFNQLRIVKMEEMTCTPNEMEVIKLLLAKSPVLERMNIEFWSLTADLGWDLMLTLLEFPRASGKAGVFVTNSDTDVAQI